MKNLTENKTELDSLLESYEVTGTSNQHKENAQFSKDFMEAMDKELPDVEDEDNDIDGMMGALDKKEIQAQESKEGKFVGSLDESVAKIKKAIQEGKKEDAKKALASIVADFKAL